MGKGQRSREARIEERANNPQKRVVKRKKSNKTGKKWVTPLVSILVVVLIVGIFALTYLSDNGIILRSKTVMESENYKISGTVMKVATMSAYRNFLNTYGDLVSYFGLDTSKSLESQEYGEGTWLDYFRDGAETTLKSALVYAEAAKEAGVTLDEDEKKAIDESMDAIGTVALANGYNERSYLALLYGKGVNINDVREFEELMTLAGKYETKVRNDTKDSITDEEVSEYYDENKDNFAISDVLSYTETIKISSDLSEEEKAAKKLEILAKFDAMKAAQSEEEFKAALLAYYKETAKEDDEETPEDKVEAALTTVKKSQVALEEASEWLFEQKDGEYVRAEGDLKLFVDDAEAPKADDKTENDENNGVETAETETGDTDEAVESETDTSSDSETAAAETDAPENEETKPTELSYTVTIYYVVKAPYANEELTKNVGHILFSLNSYASEAEAKEAAGKVYDEFVAGDKTKESFEKLAEENTDDSGIFYEDVLKGEMVSEFDAWIYDEARKEGDTGVVLTDYGYHVMYFMGDGIESWASECKTSITNEKTEKTYEEYEEKYAVSVNEKAMNSVKA
ncbi:MAG: peptidylprolyl isomerase [Clostridia bacterium]|nr:peptidylprolyl isomerase [Clostridia bacterium]